MFQEEMWSDSDVGEVSSPLPKCPSKVLKESSRLPENKTLPFDEYNYEKFKVIVDFRRLNVSKLKERDQNEPMLSTSIDRSPKFPTNEKPTKSKTLTEKLMPD